MKKTIAIIMSAIIIAEILAKVIASVGAKTVINTNYNYIHKMDYIISIRQ